MKKSTIEKLRKQIDAAACKLKRYQMAEETDGDSVDFLGDVLDDLAKRFEKMKRYLPDAPEVKKKGGSK